MYDITDDIYGRTLRFTPKNEGERPDEEIINQMFDQMYGGELVFDKLHENKKYIEDLKADYKASEGKDFKGDVRDLIEEDFEYWNLIDNSIVATGAETAMTFKDMSKEEKQRTMRRFDIYNRTNATGEGSRSFFEQLKGVGTGIAVDMAVPIGAFGKLFKFGSKAAGASLTKAFLKKVLFPGLTGASWGGGMEYSRQEREIALEARDSLDTGEIGTSTAVGGVLGPAAPAAVKATGAATRFIAKPVSIAVSKTKRELAKKAAQRKVVDTLGGGPLAKKAVAEEAGEVLGKGEFTETAERLRYALQETFSGVDNSFRQRFKGLGELDMTTDVLEKFSKRMAKEGVPTDNVNIIIGQAKAGNITATEALRKIRRELSNMSYNSRISKDPAVSSKSMLYDEWADKGRMLFSGAASRSGKGKEAKVLDSEYSSWLDFKKNSGSLFKSREDGEKIAQKMKALVAAPELTPTKLNTIYNDINKLTKASDIPGLDRQIKKHINEMVKSKMFENNGKRFVNMVENKEGLKALKMLFPQQKVLLDDYHSIVKSAGSSPAMFFWGRIMAASMAGSGAAATTGILGGGMAMAATMIMMNTALKSKAFRNLAMNAYKGGKPQPKVINGMVKWLNDKGFDGASIRDYLLGSAVITGGALVDEQSTIRDKAVETAQPYL